MENGKEIKRRMCRGRGRQGKDRPASLGPDPAQSRFAKKDPDRARLSLFVFCLHVCVPQAIESVFLLAQTTTRIWTHVFVRCSNTLSF
jgi:hypothetical protein